jgi:hypothetical protein
VALVCGSFFGHEAGAEPGPAIGAGTHGKETHRTEDGAHRSCAVKGGRHAWDNHQFGPDWRETLSPEQEAQLDQLRANFAKSHGPLGARIKALQLDLAVLAIAPQPDNSVMDAKLAELMALERQLMGTEYAYIAAQRRLLTPPQQVSFDTVIIHDAMHGKRSRGCRCGH